MIMHEKIFKNVKLGKNVSIGDFCIIGLPPDGHEEGQLPTVIGDDAVIRSHTVIYAGNEIGQKFRTGHHVVIRENNKFGDNVSVGTNSVVEHHINISDNVRLHSNVFVPEYSRLERGAWIGPNSVLTNAKFPMAPGVKDNLKGPIVGEGAKLGANCTLLPDITVGAGALVGAGSVVTKDVNADVVVVGNPAKEIGKVEKEPYTK
jgi:acetyltransferase-like isoleucine patch superfamily enzyme